MNCTDCQERLDEYALSTLPGDEAAAVDAHLASGCRACRQELDEVQSALAAVALSLPPIELPAHVKHALMARVRSDETGVVPASLASSLSSAPARESWLRSVAPYLAAMLCAVAAGMFAVNGLVGPRDRQAAATRAFEERLAAAQQTFQSPRVRFASFDFSDARTGIAGYLVLDSLAKQVHFVAFDLGAPAAGREYRLWFVTRDEQWVPAGTLAVDDSGNSSAVVDLPAMPGEVARAVVTEELAVDASDGAGSESNAAPEKPQGATRLEAEF
jgi:hypothetical protein